MDIHSNLYCAGAKAYAREEDARFCDTPCSVTVSENGCAVTLSVTGAHPDQSVSLVSSDMLGVAFQPNQRFENTDGTPIVIDSDIQGKPRTESCSAAGPINNSQTDYTLTWTL